jgi:4-hydroxy-3-methylbut-2-enyl diphosphate reductase
VYRVNVADQVPDDLTGTVGVTAGASAPEELVESVLDRLAPRHGIDVVRITEEDEYFPPPRAIRELQTAIETASTALLGGALLEQPAMDDRNLPASEVLAALVD